MNFFDTLSTEFNIRLNEQQQEAVRHQNGPALVLSGPGSGKTTVITARTAYLVMEAGVNPGSILTMTFNRAAKHEMEARFTKTFGGHISGKVHFSTLHSFCNSVVWAYEKRQGRRLKRIEGEEETEESKRKILKGIYYRINNASINEDELENLTNEIGFAKNKMLKDLEEYEFNTKNFASIYKAYEEHKKANLLIDFDDMLSYAYNILLKFPDMLQYYRNKYRYIQVDEGQDLSRIQFEIVKLLVRWGDNNLFIVADDDQSIYGFRGAEPEDILNMTSEFPGCKIYRLENNYRSSRNIVETTSHFIKYNTKRYDKNHRTGNRYICDPRMEQPRDEQKQSKFLVDTVKDRLKEANKTVGILYRNNLSSVAVADALDRNGIKFHARQNKLFFFNHWAVQDILAFLRFSLDPCNRNAFMRIYYKMNRFISKAMVEQAFQADEASPVIDCILTGSEIKPFQKNQLTEVRHEFKRMSKMQTSRALEYIESGFNYFDNAGDYCKSTGLSFDYVYGLFGILKTIACHYPAIPLFLQRMEALEGILNHGGQGGPVARVTLTTVHSSKGLEYDCVIMIDLTGDEFPGRRAAEAAGKCQDSRELEEERRLFYVGMTRAREQLYLVSPQTKNDKTVPHSRFIDEVVQCTREAKLGHLGEGVTVLHKQFGKGVIAAIHETKKERIILEVDFRGKRKTLDFATCMENDALSFDM